MTEEHPENDILLDAKWSILTDGRGYNVLLLGGVPFTDGQGRKAVRLRIQVDDIVKKRYPQIIGALDDSNRMNLIVLESDLVALNIFDDANRKWQYLRTLTGDSTDLSERETMWRDRVSFAENRNLLLEAQIVKLNEQLELAKLEAGKYVSQGVEVYEKATSVIASAVQKAREGEK